MNIEEMTIGQAREIAALFSKTNAPVAASCGHPFVIGKNYFIRTVTHHYTGKLVNVFSGELLLETAAWIPDDGRFQGAVTKSDFAEVEPYGHDQQVIIGRGSILDAVQITTLPVSQK